MLLVKLINQTEQQSLVPEVQEVATPKQFNYPLDPQELFPYWIQTAKVENQPNLIDLVKYYYEWLYNNTGNITPYFGFFELDKLKDHNKNTQKTILDYFINTYLPSLDKSLIGTQITTEQVKSIINSVKVKLNNRKGTESSFKYLISLFFNLQQSDIYITYPKKYLMVLNGGINSEIAGADPNLRGKLNFSILQDNTIWNDYTYIINIENIAAPSSGQIYENVLKPLLHPAGFNDRYQERKDIFNRNNENFDQRVSEIPYVKNYTTYTLNDTSSVYECGDVYVQHVFPSWAQSISDGVPFGSINIGTFLELRPKIEGNFPNDSLTC